MPFSDPRRRAQILDELHRRGGLRPGVSREIGRDLGVPEADVYGAASFYHLLKQPDRPVQICQGLTCRMAGAEDLLRRARARGLPAAGSPCLAACDHAPVGMVERRPIGHLTTEHFDRVADQLAGAADPSWPSTRAGHVALVGLDAGDSVFGLQSRPDYGADAFQRARAMGREAVLDELDRSGLQGRGGAGFPTGRKWRSILAQPETERYVVLNADEGEPGTFKDRELLIRRPDLVLEGLAIAAWVLGARRVYLYLRGEFTEPWRCVDEAIDAFRRGGWFPEVSFHLHAGHGAYICGEETALLEALEGKRGMPRLKPPYPTQAGLFGRPTLIQNVETIACVPAIVRRGGASFRRLGRTEPGAKLYCLSGRVVRPGVFEAPLGVCLDELVEAAGGYRGTLGAFSPGGASSGFLPAGERRRPLDFAHLREVGSMLGSAGIVVLDDQVDLAWAVRQQLRFFEHESCGQCAPCRIGTRALRECLDRYLALRDSDPEGAREALDLVADVAWEMEEGSICGLGQAAPLPLTSALRFFPDRFLGALREAD